MPSHTKAERAKKAKVAPKGSGGADFSGKKTGVMAPSGRLKIPNSK